MLSGGNLGDRTANDNRRFYFPLATSPWPESIAGQPQTATRSALAYPNNDGLKNNIAECAGHEPPRLR